MNDKVSLNKINCDSNGTVIIANIHVSVHVAVHLGSGPSILIVHYQ